MLEKKTKNVVEKGWLNTDPGQCRSKVNSQSFISVITEAEDLIQRLQTSMNDNEASLVAARADRYDVVFLTAC